MPPEIAYKSYLLRLWRTGSPQPVWRASLEEPHTGQLLHFATLERLFAFLEDQTVSVPGDHTSPLNDATEAS